MIKGQSLKNSTKHIALHPSPECDLSCDKLQHIPIPFSSKPEEGINLQMFLKAGILEYLDSGISMYFAIKNNLWLVIKYSNSNKQQWKEWEKNPTTFYTRKILSEK